jgi:hypothetical protein
MMSIYVSDTEEQLSQDSTAMTTDRQYNSTLAGKGAFLSDAKTVLREIDAGRHPDQVRRAVIEDDLLDHRTRHSRSTVWKEIFRRYISERDPKHVTTLARMVARCPNPTAADLVLFYEYCQADFLLYDLTAYCTYELYQNARTAIDKVDINEWLSQQEANHPKEFHKLYVPREAFVYALYHQKDQGIQGKALIYATDWRLFLLSEREVIFLLEDVANGGFIHFRHAGDIYDLRFVYHDLSEVVHAITD